MTNHFKGISLVQILTFFMLLSSCTEPVKPVISNTTISNPTIKFDFNKSQNLTNLDPLSLMPIRNQDILNSFKADSITITDSVILLTVPSGSISLPNKTRLQEGEIICKMEENSVSTVSIGSIKDLPIPKNTQPQGTYSIDEYNIISPDRYNVCFQLKKVPLSRKCYVIKEGRICILNKAGNYEVYITN